jgi:hypothetical protein
MFSTPANTLEERAILMRLLARLQTVPPVVGLEAGSAGLDDTLHADTRQYAAFRSPRQIVMVRANHICRRRFPSLLELAGVEGSANEAGRGWHRGSAWDDTDESSIFDRLNAAAVAGGLSALGAARQPAAVIHDAVQDTPGMTNGDADDAVRDVPVLV